MECFQRASGCRSKVGSLVQSGRALDGLLRGFEGKSKAKGDGVGYLEHKFGIGNSICICMLR